MAKALEIKWLKAPEHHDYPAAQSYLTLLRDPAGHRVIIADGYHRLCAVYSYDEDALIPCKIV